MTAALSSTLADMQSDFDWDDYLHQLGPDAGRPAPASCFKQAAQPPGNEFQAGQRLESRDPRNRDNTCIATVVECLGPRLRLRLDGSDDRNDFYRLVDSEDLFHHPSGRFIVPPLGYAKSICTWPAFLSRVRAAGNFAPAGCFKRPPTAPARNTFSVGQHLEAVDRKHPQLVCPATVKEVRQDRLFVSFDGWRGAFDYWCRYDSRDIFPAGWCSAAGYPVQPPGASAAYSPSLTAAAGQRPAGARSKQVSGASGVSSASPAAFSDRSSASPPPLPPPQQLQPQQLQPPVASDPCSGGEDGDEDDDSNPTPPPSPPPPQPQQLPGTRPLDEEEEPGGDMSCWTVSDVSRSLRCWRLAELGPLLRTHSVDGRALQSLSAETLVHSMGAKVGPTLKLLSRVEKTRRRLNLLQCLRSLQPTGRLS